MAKKKQNNDVDSVKIEESANKESKILSAKEIAAPESTKTASSSEHQNAPIVLQFKAKLTPDEEMANLKKVIEDNVKIYNDAIKTRAKVICDEAVSAINEALKSYAKISEKKTFKSLSEKENIMLEAAKVLTFPIIRIEPDKGSDGIEYVKAVEGNKRIDPLRLDEYCDGIGADPKWKYMVEHLNFCLTARRAIELGINPIEVNDSYSMKKESKKIDSFKTSVSLSEEQKAALARNEFISFDYNTANKVLTEDIQTVVTAMLGGGFVIDERSTAYLLAVYSKRSNKKALNVVCSNHKFMRSYMMDICNMACTDNQYSITFKKSDTGNK